MRQIARLATLLCSLAVVACDASSDDVPVDDGTTDSQDVIADAPATDVNADAPAIDVAQDVPDSDAHTDTRPMDVAPDGAPDTTANTTALGCDGTETPQRRGTVPDDLVEISGIVADPREPDVLWALEDSGADAVLVAIDLEGVERARVTVAGARNRDWEDLAAGPCGSDTCLYVGDFGDNTAARDVVTIHRVPLPRVDGPGEVQATSMRVRWPDGPRDCEALAVLPDESVMLLSKEVGRSRIGLARFEPDAEVVLQHAGTLDLAPWRIGGLVTGADLRDGWLLVRLYADVLAFEIGDDPAALPTAPSVVLASPRELQGESIAWLDAGYATVSEGRSPSIFVVECDDGTR